MSDTVFCQSCLFISKLWIHKNYSNYNRSCKVSGLKYNVWLNVYSVQYLQNINFLKLNMHINLIVPFQ
jgi:hypothetical protein